MDDQQDGNPTNQGFSTPPSNVASPGGVQPPTQPPVAQAQLGYPPTQPVAQPQAPVQQAPVEPGTPQYTQPAAGQPPAREPKSSQKILIGLAIITLIVAAIGGFYLGSSGLINGGTPTPTPTTPPVREPSTAVTSPTATPTPEAALESKLFDSDKLSFSYPGYFPELTLKVDEDGVEIQPRTFEASYLAPGQEGSVYTALLQVVGPEANPEGFKLKQWLGETGKLTPEGGLEVDIASTTIAGKEASILTGYRPGTNDPGLKSAYFILDDGVYSVILQIVEGAPELAKYESGFDAIAASISFK